MNLGHKQENVMPFPKGAAKRMYEEKLCSTWNLAVFAVFCKLESEVGF